MNILNMYGVINSENNIDVLWTEDGTRVTQFHETLPIVWPVNSNVSAYHEHLNTGIVLTHEDALKIGLLIA